MILQHALRKSKESLKQNFIHDKITEVYMPKMYIKKHQNVVLRNIGILNLKIWDFVAR